ncbi:MAG TPA: hypothetical protein VFB22_01410 [Candidatus Baltobacteraceae bacterium]|nr:hypothetical protein [Candidatus Baltobacteraceae bacterium]
MRCGIRLVVDVRALVVVELHRENAVGDGPELVEHAMQPARRVAQVRTVAQPFAGCVVAVRVLQRRRRGIPAFEHVVQRHVVLGPRQQPGGIASVAPLVADHGPGPHDEAEAQLFAQPQHFAQIPARIRTPVEVEFAVGDLVPAPRDVQVERVRTEPAHRQHRRAPALRRDAIVEERAAPEEEGPPVDDEPRRAEALLHDRVAEARRGVRRGAGREERAEQRDARGARRSQARHDARERTSCETNEPCDFQSRYGV